MLEKIKSEPAMVTALVLALIGVATAFGFAVSDDQRSAIVAAVGAVLAIVGGGVTRSQVVPLAHLSAPAGPAVPWLDPQPPATPPAPPAA